MLLATVLSIALSTSQSPPRLFSFIMGQMGPPVVPGEHTKISSLAFLSLVQASS